MNYENVRKAIFMSRPNRFIAHVLVDEVDTVVHVKNTGRCRELLVPGAEVFLEKAKSNDRKTPYDLITVRKGQRLINMDSQAPNRIFAEWVKTGGGFAECSLLKAECTYKNSRFDFYYETPSSRGFVEVKGVTLEENGVVRFPDAPTQRGVKHIEELMDAKENGYDAWVVFIVQMNHVSHFEPNDHTHPEFGEVLRKAKACGVRMMALTCEVSETTVIVDGEIPMVL